MKCFNVSFMRPVVSGVITAIIIASAVGASVLVIDADVVVPVSVHEALVAVAERGSVKDGLAGTGRLIHAGTSLQGGRATVVIVAVAIVIPVAGLSVGFNFCLAELGWYCSNLLKVDGSGGY